MVWNEFTQAQRIGSVLEVFCAETGALSAHVVDGAGTLWDSSNGADQIERKEIESVARAALASCLPLGETRHIDRAAGRWYFLSVSGGFAFVARFADVIGDVARVRAAAQRAWRKVEDLPRFGGGDGSPRGTGRID